MAMQRELGRFGNPFGMRPPGFVNPERDAPWPSLAGPAAQPTPVAKSTYDPQELSNPGVYARQGLTNPSIYAPNQPVVAPTPQPTPVAKSTYDPQVMPDARQKSMYAPQGLTNPSIYAPNQPMIPPTTTPAPTVAAAGAAGAAAGAKVPGLKPDMNDEMMNLQGLQTGPMYAATQQINRPAGTEYRNDLGYGNYIGGTAPRSAESVDRMRGIIENSKSPTAASGTTEEKAAAHVAEMARREAVAERERQDAKINPLLATLTAPPIQGDLFAQRAQNKAQRNAAAALGLINNTEQTANYKQGLVSQDKARTQQAAIADQNLVETMRNNDVQAAERDARLRLDVAKEKIAQTNATEAAKKLGGLYDTQAKNPWYSPFGIFGGPTLTPELQREKELLSTPGGAELFKTYRAATKTK